jgi:hypothetical protein
LIFYSNIVESEKPLTNTTLDLNLPLDKYGNFYNFSYLEESNPRFFNNSVLYKIGGEDGFIRDTEIQGFHTYSLEEVRLRNKSFTYMNMSEIGMKISADYYAYMNYAFIN